jgi:7,8-dihydropterin-6-yl-methyl-4-(beta-D-ribofuranosyl)aminobenzene 5'-phosphate synthase
MIYTDNICITVVYDNCSYNEFLQPDWGFSCIIKAGDKTILFDTGGNGDILLENMTQLSFNPVQIDCVVISHIHYDHTGGLQHFLDKHAQVDVYMPQSSPDSFKKDVQEAGAKVIKIQNFFEMYPSIYTTGELGDQIKEQSLVIKTNEGVVVITGCAHPGIIKILEKIKHVLHEQILLVMGGFHLLKHSRSDIQSVASEFKKLGIAYVAPSHCSGEQALCLFEQAYGNNFIKSGVGRNIRVGNLRFS